MDELLHFQCFVLVVTSTTIYLTCPCIYTAQLSIDGITCAIFIATSASSPSIDIGSMLIQRPHNVYDMFNKYLDGLVQERRYYITSTLQLRLSCTHNYVGHTDCGISNPCVNHSLSSDIPQLCPSVVQSDMGHVSCRSTTQLEGFWSNERTAHIYNWYTRPIVGAK